MIKKHLLYFIITGVFCFVLSTTVYGFTFQEKTEHVFEKQAIYVTNGIQQEADPQQKWPDQDRIVASIKSDAMQAVRDMDIHLIDGYGKSSEAPARQEDSEPYLSSLVSSAVPAAVPDEPAAMIVLGFGLVFFAGFAKKRIVRRS